LSELCLIQALAPYIVAGIAFIGVFITAFFAFRTNNKNLLIKTVTEERAKWRRELREVCGEFVKLIYEQVSIADKSNAPRINELKVQMKLRVNPSQKDKHILDQNIIKVSQEVVNLIERNFDKDEVIKKLIELEGYVQALLKQEWDKSKKEAVDGKLSE